MSQEQKIASQEQQIDAGERWKSEVEWEDARKNHDEEEQSSSPELNDASV